MTWLQKHKHSTPKSLRQYDIIITGAGTGGHVLTALSVYDKLVALEPEFRGKILFVGSINLRKGMAHKPSLEERLCKERKVPFVKIRTGKVQRFLEWRTLKLLLNIPLGFWDAFRIILRTRPKIVFATGGYVTPPIVFWAKIFGAKTFLHEQTLSPGLASRVASNFSDYVMISFLESREHFVRISKWKRLIQIFNKHAFNNQRENVIYTGYPIQDYMVEIKTFEDLHKYIKQKSVKLGVNLAKLGYDRAYLNSLKGLESLQKPLIFISGGSTGAHALNNVVYKALPDLLRDYVVFIQTGDNVIFKDISKFKRFKQQLPQRSQKDLIGKEFLKYEMGYVLRKASIVVSRSGAGSVYQIGMLRKPSILVPLPNTSGNEQVKNAQLLEQIGLATIIPQDKLTPIVLKTAIVHRLKHANNMSLLNNDMFPNNASEIIAHFLYEQYSRLLDSELQTNDK